MSAVPTLTTLGASIWICGVLRGKEDLVLHGCIEGHLALDGKLQIAPRGVVRASVRASEVVVAGDVWGNIDAREAIHIEATGRVFGDVYAPKVTLASGAILHGTVHVERTTLIPLGSTVHRETPVHALLANEPGRGSVQSVSAAVALHDAKMPASVAISPTGMGMRREERFETPPIAGAILPDQEERVAVDERQPAAAVIDRTQEAPSSDWIERPRMRPISLLPPQAHKLPKKRRMGILVKRRGDP